MTQEASFSEIQLRSSEIVIRKIGVIDLWQSLKEGYEDFIAKPSFGVFLVVVYPLFALLNTLSGDHLVYLAFSMVAGLTFLGPVVSGNELAKTCISILSDPSVACVHVRSRLNCFQCRVDRA